MLLKGSIKFEEAPKKSGASHVVLAFVTENHD